MESLVPRLGVVLTAVRDLRAARSDDPVDLVVLRQTLHNPPREAGARSIASSIQERFPDAAVIPYVWHLVSHGPQDGLWGEGTRTLAGEPQRFCRLQDTPEVAAAWQITLQIAGVFGASQVVLRTPPGLTPGAIGEARLRAFATARAAEGIELLWESDGLWDEPTITRLTRELGMYAIAPALSATGRPPKKIPPRRWLRVDGLGGRRDLRAGPAEGLAMLLEAAEEPTTVLFAGPRAFENLRVFRRVLELG